MEKKGNKQELQSARHSLINTLGKILNRKSGRARNEFRYNKTTRHINHIISADEKNDEYIALGLTSEPETFGIKNMPLTENPKKGKTTPSHIRNGEIVDKRKNFSKKREKNYGYAQKDIPNVKAKKRNAKKNVKRAKKEQKNKKK